MKTGPLVSAGQRAIVARPVEDAERRGRARSVGGPHAGWPGWFYPATVLADVDPSWPVARDETFGPVVCLPTFDGDEGTALELADDTPTGSERASARPTPSAAGASRTGRAPDRWA